MDITLASWSWLSSLCKISGRLERFGADLAFKVDWSQLTARKYSAPAGLNHAFFVLRIVANRLFIATQFNVFAVVLARDVE